MMKVKDHYDKHLAHFYAWMAGDLEDNSKRFRDFLHAHSIHPSQSKVAIDLGAGHGIQSLALAALGFRVKAVDFSSYLLQELAENAGPAPIQTIQADIRAVKSLSESKPELIVCCGDTITHLPDKNEIRVLLEDCYNTLTSGGKLILSFRDYSKALVEDQRFIPVKSTPDRILTCFLEYDSEKVKVTDLLHERVGQEWKQKVSSYEKVRISAADVEGWLQEIGFQIQFNESIRRMSHLVAIKE